MRIQNGDVTDNMEIQLNQTRQSREVADSGTAPAGSTTAGGSSDSINITGSGGLVQSALSAGAQERADRVEQLKQLVNSNQYSVDPEAVSRALIGAHLAGD
ncbi:MAG TPA: flagellar biosynthesis anti-sigma factor FlgM [Bryobacteraceae bacterium]|nr:flagellar biosynthesis anti-sigma factor FlgM [Bryobacteraceae bacterium]